MPMQETRQESKTVPLHQPAAPAGPAQTANTPRSHSLALKDRSRLALTGVIRIISCDENAAVLETPLGNLTVGGQGLQVSELSVASGLRCMACFWRCMVWDAARAFTLL